MPAGRRRSQAEGSLPSFFAAAASEFASAAEDEGRVDCRLRFADRCVTLSFAGAGLADTLLAALRHRCEDRAGPAQATISIWEELTAGGQAVPFPWTEAEVAPGGLVRGSELEGLLAVHETFTGAITLADVGGRAVLHRVRDRATIPWWERAAPLRSAVACALGGQAGVVVHAGAVGDDRGAVMIAGPRGSGKTTVVWASLAHGFQFVADDYLLLCVDASAEPEARSLYSTVSVRAAPEDEHKSILDLTSAMPGSLREALPVRAVVVPRIGDAPPGLHRISPGATLLALAPTTVFQSALRDGAAMASLARVVRHVPCFRLDLDHDQTAIARAVGRVLDEAAP